MVKTTNEGRGKEQSIIVCKEQFMKENKKIKTEQEREENYKTKTLGNPS